MFGNVAKQLANERYYNSPLKPARRFFNTCPLFVCKHCCYRKSVGFFFYNNVFQNNLDY